MNKKYQQCTQCVMDTEGNPGIYFDENGICNFCNEYESKKKLRIISDKKEREHELEKIVNKIKRKGEGKKYDCIIGVSGGVDSTYTAYYVKEVLGLKPLAVHFDNGWNSELAVKNIENTLKKLDIDLYTYVVNWQEFKDIQLSFLKSSTPDGEIPTDHAINSILIRTANKWGIKYIIKGFNFQTESIMPRKWAYGHLDWKYIKNIHKKFGNKEIKTYPHLNLKDLFYYFVIKRIKTISILNYIDFDKNKVQNIIEKELNWKNYKGKHYESIYTRFYQSYFLPEKFKIDKRKAHFSNLILAGQMDRMEAISKLKEPIIDEETKIYDIEYIKKKFNLSNSSFDKILNSELNTCNDFPNSQSFIDKLKSIISFLRTKKLFPR